MRILRHLPSKEELMVKIRELHFGEGNEYLIGLAYDKAVEVHKFGPARKSGEPYVCHPYRCVLHAIRTQRHLGIRSPTTCILLFMHDGVEDAKESKQDPRLVSRDIIIVFGPRIGFIVVTSTKRKDQEDGVLYLVRISHSDEYEILWSKCEDKFDNLLTLGAMPLANQERKIREYEQCFPAIYERLEFVVNRMIEHGEISPEDADKWRRLPGYLRRRNDREKNKRKRELKARKAELVANALKAVLAQKRGTQTKGAEIVQG